MQAYEMGKKVGVVSTTRITHATPAAVYSRSVDRDYEAGVPEGCTTQTDIASQVRCTPVGLSVLLWHTERIFLSLSFSQ